MNLVNELSPGDGELHRQNLILLQAAKSTASFPVLAGRSGGAFDGTDQGVYFAATPSQSPIWIVWSVPNNTLVILLGGMQGYDQAPAVLASWSDNPDNTAVGNIFYAEAAFILNNLPAAPGGGWSKLRIIGHSFGGAVAWWLGRLMGGFVNQGVEREIYTYGSPKPVSGGPMQGLTGLAYRRYCIADDPVPSFPPGPDDLGSVWTLVGVPTARKWATWRQPSSAFVRVANTGRVALAQSSRTPDTNFILTTLSWITGSTAFGSDRHTLEAYQNDVALLSSYTVPEPLPQPIEVREHRRTITAVVYEAMREEQITIVASNNSATIQDTAVGILSGVTSVPGTRYRGIKIRGRPWVYYGDQPITPCKTTRVRRALVRWLNRRI